MKVGLFYDLRNPAGWRRPWAEHYARTLEHIERAEQLGADAVWFSEHHFFDDGYLPQPLTFAAAVAARTSRVRIGTAVVVAALRHPLHVAEQAALVDLISAGRMELGIGAGSAPREYAAFGVDVTRRYSHTDAAVAEVRRLLDEDAITPPPLQRPFPLWLGYQGPRGARRAGRLGVGLLSLAPQLSAAYQEGLVEGGYAASSARMGGVLDIVVAADPDAARERLLPYYAHQLNSYRVAATPPDQPPPREVTVDKLRERFEATGAIPGLTVATPDDAIAAIRERTAGLPVEHVYLWASIAGMPDDLAAEHLELTLTRVRPALVRSEEGAG